jgi:hypothetical protein
MIRKLSLTLAIAVILIAVDPLAQLMAAEADTDRVESAVETAIPAGEEVDAGAEGSDAEKKCVLLRSIDRTDVIDDYNILFYMRGPDIYHVHMPYRCPGLRSADSFMYRTSLNVLCDLDVIRPLRNFGGGFTPGAACGMGRFVPITKEEIAILKNRDIKIEPARGEPEVEDLNVEAPEEVADQE